MNSCIVIQCFCKPVETIKTLNSLEKCKEIIKYNLLLFVDKTNDNRFMDNNLMLIKKLEEYKEKSEHLYKNIKIIVSRTNLGPYQSCFDSIEHAFTYNNYVIFSEDDIIFCKDSINYYNDFRDKKMDYDDKCVGITSSSNRFYPKKNIYSKKNINIEIAEEYRDKVNEIKLLINNNDNLLNAIEKFKWAPNKQMGIFQEGWNKIKRFRDLKNHPALYTTPEYKGQVPDYATGKYIQNSPFYFIYSFIPRSNDIGLFNELGCTTLYFNGNPGYSTIKYLTSDDFDSNNNSYKYLNNLNEFNTIID